MLLESAAQMDASDLHISPASPLCSASAGDLRPACDTIVTSEISEESQGDNERRTVNTLKEKGECDFAIQCPANTVPRKRFQQRQSIAIALRLIKSTPPDINELGPPPIVSSLCSYKRG
jgi:Tfp pilus assembly pilus retraction ATPase PilT